MTRKVEDEEWRAIYAECEWFQRLSLRCDEAKHRRRAAKLILQAARRDPMIVSAEAVAEANLVLAAEAAGRVRVTVGD